MKIIFSKEDIANMCRAVSVHGKDAKLIDLCNLYLDKYTNDNDNDIEVEVTKY